MIADEINRLHELHQAGALSDAEFEQAKAKVLSQSAVNLNKDAGDGTLGAEINRLRRSRSDRWLGGVCGGLGQASGVESWVWRLMFVLCTVFLGFGFLIYLLMWIFVPEE